MFIQCFTSYDPFGYDYMMYTIHNKCDELPNMEYNNGLKYIYFYTKGKKGGSKEIKALPRGRSFGQGKFKSMD